MNKKIELYDVDMNYIKTFETTEECAEFFDKDTAYINHNLKYRDKIRKDGKWYKIRRIVIDEKQQEVDRLNNIINELEKDIKNLYTYGIKNNAEQRDYLLNRLEGLKALKEE